MLTIDFETYYDKDYSLSKMSTEAYIRDPRFEVIGVCVKKNDGPIRWITGTHDEIKAQLDVYDMASEVVVAHNAVFDMAILNWIYDIRPKFIVDTVSMARPVTGLTVGASLRALSEFFNLGHKGTEIYNTMGKRRKDFTPDELEAFANYCTQDVALTYKLYHRLKNFSTKKEMYLIDLVIRMFTEPVMELDEDLLATHLEKVKKEKEALINSIGHDRDLFMSNEKFAELLRAEGVEPPMKTSPATGKQTYAFAKTDPGFKALLESNSERVQALATARLGLKSTIEETRTQAFLDIARRGKFPVMLNYYGAVNTGRFSGGDNTNPQNLPRGGALRQSIKPPEGYLIVACDSSQIEARTLAWFAGQQDLIKGFANGEDIYCAFATSVFGRPITKADKKERFVGKTCILGLGYQVGAATLQNALRNGKVNLDIEECKRIVSLYRTKYRAISTLWNTCSKLIENMYKGFNGTVGEGVELNMDGVDKTITMPNGMVLRYPDLQAGVNERGYNEYTYQKKQYRARLYGGAMTENIIQALARTIVSYQMCKIKQALDKRSAEAKDGKIRRIAHMVHDEVIVVVPEEEAEHVKTLMEQIMSTPPSWAPDLPVSCEAGVGTTYAEAK